MKFSIYILLAIFTLTSHAEKLNVLFICADDLNIDIGCYGNKQVKTPNLDRLAKMGMRFENAYCQQAICGPSRASVMTGLRPDTTGFHTNDDKLRKLIPDVVTLGQFLKNDGYYSGRVGKIFHYSNPAQIGTNGNDDELTWSERFNPRGIDRDQEDKITLYPADRKNRSFGRAMAWWDPVSEDIQHTDGLVAAKAVEMIEKSKDKPFFIATGFFRPHCPYIAPRKYFDLYPIDEIKLQDLETAKKQLAGVPPIALEKAQDNWPYGDKNVTWEEARKCKQAYYASISFLDTQVGHLLDAIEKNNLNDKTLIVFWSDHGYFLGERGLWYKHKNFERAVKVPLLIAGPGVKQNSVCNNLVELVDLYPTIISMTGHEIPSGLDGVSLKPLLENPQISWDKPAFSQVYYGKDKQGYTVRTNKWRYTEWNEGTSGKELYDHDKDPDELNNLAEKNEFSEIVTALSLQLKNYKIKYKKK